MSVNNDMSCYKLYLWKKQCQHTTVSKATGRHLDFGLLLTSITVATEFYIENIKMDSTRQNTIDNYKIWSVQTNNLKSTKSMPQSFPSENRRPSGNQSQWDVWQVMHDQLHNLFLGIVWALAWEELWATLVFLSIPVLFCDLTFCSRPERKPQNQFLRGLLCMTSIPGYCNPKG